MAKVKSRRQCKKCDYINDCDTIKEWRQLVTDKKMKRIIYDQKLIGAVDDCPDYHFTKKKD